MDQAAVAVAPAAVADAPPVVAPQVVQESELIKLTRTLSLSSLLGKQEEQTKLYAAKAKEYTEKKAALEAEKADTLKKNEETKAAAIAARSAEVAVRWAWQRIVASTIDFDQKFATLPVEQEFSKKLEALQTEYKQFETEEAALATLVQEKIEDAVQTYEPGVLTKLLAKFGIDIR